MFYARDYCIWTVSVNHHIIVLNLDKNWILLVLPLFNSGSNIFGILIVISVCKTIKKLFYKYQLKLIWLNIAWQKHSQLHIFSYDEQLKKWPCHSVRMFVRSFVCHAFLTLQYLKQTLMFQCPVLHKCFINVLPVFQQYFKECSSITSGSFP